MVFFKTIFSVHHIFYHQRSVSNLPGSHPHLSDEASIALQADGPQLGAIVQEHLPVTGHSWNGWMENTQQNQQISAKIWRFP